MLNGKTETAQHRAEFLACLETGLSVADEDFLEEVRGGDRVLPCGTGVASVTCDPGIPNLALVCRDVKETFAYRRLLGWSVDPIA